MCSKGTTSRVNLTIPIIFLAGDLEYSRNIGYNENENSGMSM